jgi:hypothetical protein
MTTGREETDMTEHHYGDDRGLTVYDLRGATEVDLGYTPEGGYVDGYDRFWEAADALPVGGVIAAGWEGDLAYWRKDSDTDFAWTLVHLDFASEDVVESLAAVGIEVGYQEIMDANTLSAGGDIEKAYVVKPREEF